MNVERIIDSLEHFATVLPTLVRDLSLEQVRWKPPSGNWSILEVVGHLGDEEVEDFRTRVRLTLEDPAQSWPAIDPQRWAGERNYNQQDLAHAVERFVRERRHSVDWLRKLEDPDWSQSYQHPKFGKFCAGDILASWAAHDHLHLRQIAKRMYEMTEQNALPYGVRYAGSW